MRQLRRAQACAAAAITLILAVSVLALAACGGVSFAEFPAFPPPPTAAPPWPSGARPQPAVTYPVQSATTQGCRAGCDGWVFEPTVDIEVSALGFYDDEGDGLSSPHRAAIFDAVDKRAVVETMISTESALERCFRWERVGPVVLEAGHEYVMAWDTRSPFDPEVLNPEDACLALELRYLGYRETADEGPQLGCPAACAKDVSLSGNFKYRPVPDAGSGLQ